MRYVIRVVVASANSGNGKYRRPVHIRVMDSTVSEWHAVRRLIPGLIREWKNCDSRYKGMRSDYGKSIRQARELCNRLNAEAEAEVFCGAGI